MFLSLVIFSLVVLVVPRISHSQSANDGFDPNADGPVWSIAVQADGKILLSGSQGSDEQHHLHTLMGRSDLGCFMDSGSG